jgi:hypothetical protein
MCSAGCRRGRQHCCEIGAGWGSPAKINLWETGGTNMGKGPQAALRHARCGS